VPISSLLTHAGNEQNQWNNVYELTPNYPARGIVILGNASDLILRWPSFGLDQVRFAAMCDRGLTWHPLQNAG